MNDTQYREYGYRDADEGWAHAYLMPKVEELVEAIRPRRLLEIGCGNGETANRMVLSLEVIEHLYSPRLFVDRARDALVDRGSLVLSTPFHGYWKNLALALAGKLDAHFTALWDGGHIKFWSERTLRALLEERGFVVDRFALCGRIAPLAKSMVVLARNAR
jgi:2-polyprenyl-6-hydroxyphenyl methylase/3-demethylubiquinone-9 3-methyltransferase